MPSWAVIVLILIAAIVSYPGNIIRWRRMREFYRRPSAEAEWRLAFPGRSAEEIRDFLHTFLRAFGIRKKHWRVFRPDDALYTVYRALNPEPWNMQTDCMEYEWFDRLLTKKYQLDLRGTDKSTTLGEVFARTKMAASEREYDESKDAADRVRRKSQWSRRAWIAIGLVYVGLMVWMVFFRAK